MNFPPVAQSPLSQLISWMARPYRFLDECAQRYGHQFTVRFVGFPPLLFLSDPQAIKEIFAADGKLFDVGRGQGILRPLLGDASVLVIDGDRHKRERKLLMPPFHGARVKSYADTICQITADIADQWPARTPVLASKEMAKVTLEVILQTVFGLRKGDRYQQLRSLLMRFTGLTDSPLSASLLFFPFLQKDLGPWSPWGRFVRIRKQIYDLLQVEIDERRSHPEKSGDDVLSLLLLARDEAGQPMTDLELKDELITMLVAGHETTAHSLTWALYWIHKLPEVKTKLLAELNSVPAEAESLTFASLPYLTAVVSETLRIYPIAPIVPPRIAKEQVTIQGQTFPPDTCLTPCIYSLHHREDLYPEPKTFKPERFLERQFSASEFIPFGGGNRRCLGYALAKLELNLVLATLLRNYSMELASDEPVTPRRRGIIVATSTGVPLMSRGKVDRGKGEGEMGKGESAGTLIGRVSQ